jgi:predicted ATPase
MSTAYLSRVQVGGYRPFRDFVANTGRFEVIVGANGSGKTSLFEFLRFLAHAADGPIPPEIVPGSAGRQIFHIPGPPVLSWGIRLSSLGKHTLEYRGAVIGPRGQVHVGAEELLHLVNETPVESLLEPSGRPNRLALSRSWQDYEETQEAASFLRAVRCYDTSSIASESLRRPATIEQGPQLREDCSNVSAVLFHLQTEHRDIFEGITRTLGLVIPGFGRLNVQARGGPGEVLAFAKIGDADLTVADLSDGQLRLLCWTTLCHLPDPGSLICIDEPDVGLHPRVLPLLAGMFKRASERTQILLATHNSFFLRQFDLNDIAVMRLENGQPKFVKPADSAVLKASLEDFGNDEIERLHQTEELEQLP